MSVVSVLQRFSKPAKRARPAEGEKCELCKAPVEAQHAHVADLQARTLACACRPCAILFAQPGAGSGRYRTVPQRVLVDPNFTLTEAEWTALQIPVRLAFFFYNTTTSRWVVLYPGPAGTTEAELPADSWSTLSERTPLISNLEPDVEALLAYAPRGAQRAECFLVPITACYELTAQLRRRWRGFDGGAEVRRELEEFFARLRAESRPFGARQGGRS